MPHHFSTGVTGGTQRTDDIRLFGDVVGNRDGKDKRQNHNNNIEECHNHGLIAAHVVTSKDDRLVQIFRQEVSQHTVLSQNRHQIFCHILCLSIIFRRIIIEPTVAVVDVIVPQRIKAVIGHNADTEFIVVKHHIRCVLKQRRIIREGYDTGDMQRCICHTEIIADLQLMVFRIQTIDCYVLLCLGHIAVQQADLIDILSLCEYPECTFEIIRLFFFIKVRVHLDAAVFLDVGKCLICGRLRKFKVAVLDVVLIKAFMIGSDQTVVCHQKSGDKGDGHDKKQKDNQIFSQLAFQFPGQTLVQWILCSLRHGLPLQFCCRNL